MPLEHHLVGGYVRYISPYIIIIINRGPIVLRPRLTPENTMHTPTHLCQYYHTSADLSGSPIDSTVLFFFVARHQGN